MMHFKDYEEYRNFRQESGFEDEKQESELVMEDNTIYEIDTNCEKCLKDFWRKNAQKKENRQ